MDDSAIVKLYLERDETAIERTDEKFGQRLRSIALGIVKDSGCAEECVNDAYMQAWNSIPPAKPEAHLYAYLARIVRNICLNRCRDQSRLKRSAHICELSRELEECIPAPETIEKSMDDELIKETINSFLGSLAPEKRSIFIRRYWYLDSVADISKRFGISQSKIKTTLFRCRNGLRKALEKEGYEL